MDKKLRDAFGIGLCCLCHEPVEEEYLVCANCAIEIDKALKANEEINKADEWKNENED